MPGNRGELQGADCGQQVHQDNAADVPSQNEFKQALEKGNDEQKIETMVRSCHCGCPALLSPPSDNLAEEDPLHNA
jgi:hypothetical protein